MRRFDLYRMTLAYLGVIFVLCAVVVFTPQRSSTPAKAPVPVQTTALPVVPDAMVVARALPVDVTTDMPQDAQVAADAPTDPAEIVAALVAQSFGAEFGEEQGEGDASAQFDTDVSPADALVAGGSDVAYTVGPGESLGSLALRFYGDSALSTIIFEANRGLMASPDSLRVGQVVIIPGRS